MPFAIEKQEYTGIISDVPDGKYIFNDNFGFHLEYGRLRWFRWSESEFIRMVHVAVRDENWMTVPYSVSDLEIKTSGEKLTITFTAFYYSSTIQFRARIEIEVEETGLKFSFSGVAEKDFLSNRIGICILLPVGTCRNQPCLITHSNGINEEGIFPTTISAHQPFKDISGFKWQTAEGVHVEIIFQGEIFEMEDQRNWADHSFKIYGTPLHIPFPRIFKEGEMVTQTATFKFSFPDQKIQTQPLFLQERSEVFSVPAIGLRYTGRIKMQTEESHLIRQLHLHHLRIELVFDFDWENKLQIAFAFAAEIGTAIELILVCEQNTVPADRLHEILKTSGAALFSILILTPGHPVTATVGLIELITQLKPQFGNVLIGTGTALHFAEINRSFESVPCIDFAALPINPQVHADDSFTMVENLQAFKEIIDTASHQFTDLNWHISRLTLRYPFNPDSSGANRYDSQEGKPWIEDPRQHSLFCAAWTALSLRYLAKTSSITLFDDFGLCGVIYASDNSNNIHSDFTISPSYLVIGEIDWFEPVSLAGFTNSQPLTADGACFFNSKGQRLVILVNWSAEPVIIETDVLESYSSLKYKMLNMVNLAEKLHLPFEWIGKQYVEIEKLQINPMILHKGAICFVLASST